MHYTNVEKKKEIDKTIFCIIKKFNNIFFYNNNNKNSMTIYCEMK